jgi:signal transduction histidine kinase
MTHPWKTWLVFALCAVVALAGLGWISLTALRLESEQVRASLRMEIEERVRLALWRMDSALAPVFIEESARPWSAYDSFSKVDLASARGKITQKSSNPASPGEVLVPSPLLSFSSSNILLHFQFPSNRRLTSPEVPESEQRKLAESGYVPSGQIGLAAERLAHLGRLLGAPVLPEERRLAASKTRPGQDLARALPYSNGDLIVRESGLQPGRELPDPTVQAPQQIFALNKDFRQVEQVQQKRNTAEYAQRANVSQQAQQQVVANNFKAVVDNAPGLGDTAMAAGVFKPVWLGDQIVLVRRVDRGGVFIVQGVWLNWTNLRASLLGAVKDLLPAAALRPVPRPKEGGESRLLASLPARLEPGLVPSSPLPWWTPARLTLALAWVGLLLAALAVALLLHGAVSLSERRAAFVSAVTHELRTPLTTFKMYSEMLADDMVPDPARRRQYLETLSVEANRLSHLVENVLAYARLEKGSARRREEKLALRELIERVKPRLEQRAAQAGMRLVEDSELRSLDTVVRVDVSAVEQILFNLVDNACKYAAPHAVEKAIHLEALPDGRFAMLRVRDHGQGISAAGARRLFQPFSKSADEAAQSAPGVGLGLALCRRLSRGMGGDLRLARAGSTGACFELLLPLSRVCP